MTRPPHMNDSTGGKKPMDQRKMAGYGSGIHGVTRKPSTSVLGNASEPLPTMQQGMLNETNLDIGNMPAKPRFSNHFSRMKNEFVDNSPTYETMAPAPMMVAPMGTAENNNSFKNKVKRTIKKSKPLLIFGLVTGTTYFVVKTVSGGRSAAREDLDYDGDE